MKRNIKGGLHRKISTPGYLMIVLSALSFVSCNSNDIDKQAGKTETNAAFEKLMKKFPKAVFPFGFSIHDGLMEADSIMPLIMTGECEVKYADALKFLCGNDKEWGTDPYMKSDTPSFVGDARLPDKGELKVLVYTRSVGDPLTDSSCATYITLSTFLRDGKMCGKIVIGGGDPLSYFRKLY